MFKHSTVVYIYILIYVQSLILWYIHIYVHLRMCTLAYVHIHRLAWRYNKHDQFLFIHTSTKSELKGVQGSFNPIGSVDWEDQGDSSAEKKGTFYPVYDVHTYIHIYLIYTFIHTYHVHQVSMMISCLCMRLQRPRNSRISTQLCRILLHLCIM